MQAQQPEISPAAVIPASSPRTPNYPFAAIVGQEEMRLALLLNAVDPRIGGVLIRGEKGTAKSTVARALAELLPELAVVRGCPYNCDPDNPAEQDAEHRAVTDCLPVERRAMRVVELPLNATEDRLAGTLDIRAALSTGQYRFEPGLLAAANRGILYVDEVNLLPDHLVDLLLDTAAMGRNTVEREGVSVTHPARFLLIGTMNPEEGELRPQLLDRFGLCVDVSGLAEIDARVEVMRRRTAYERDASQFAAAWESDTAALRERLVTARLCLPAVQASDDVLRTIAGLTLDLGVDGHRADLAILRTASAIAAYEFRDVVTRDDVRRAAALALPHRLRRRPFEQEQLTEERLQDALDRQPDVAGDERSPGLDDAGQGDGQQSEDDAPTDGSEGQPAPPEQRPAPPGDPLALPALALARDRTPRTGAGRRQQSLTTDRRGRVVGTRSPDEPTPDIALGATVRAAIARTPDPGQIGGAESAERPFLVQGEDVRVHVRERKIGATIIFIVDASGSMAARERLEAAKGAALTLLTEAYQRRDSVALIAFRGTSAETLLPPTNSVELVNARLGELSAGGRTPLAAGLRAGLELIRQVRSRDPRAIIVPVLITDGRANEAESGGAPLDEALALATRFTQPGVHSLVLDSESGFPRLGLAARLAEQAGARYVHLAELTARSVAESVQRVTAEVSG